MFLEYKIITSLGSGCVTEAYVCMDFGNCFDLVMLVSYVNLCIVLSLWPTFTKYTSYVTG